MTGALFAESVNLVGGFFPASGRAPPSYQISTLQPRTVVFMRAGCQDLKTLMDFYERQVLKSDSIDAATCREPAEHVRQRPQTLAVTFDQ
jgi:hypothetical protein